MVLLALILPAGNIADPSIKLQVQWLYKSYHQSDQAKYARSGKVLDNETLETLTKYFQAIFDQKVTDGMLHCQEQQREHLTVEQVQQRRHTDTVDPC
jgi:hypothetical protein